ncbi:hypothetical protein AAKU55_005332 [Oxalobacteraceae bacterium GrIS 1.11]
MEGDRTCVKVLNQAGILVDCMTNVKKHRKTGCLSIDTMILPL